MRRSKNVNIRFSEEEKLEIDKYIKEKTDFENVSLFIRSLIRREIKKGKEVTKQ
jgi:hypothetical protein